MGKACQNLPQRKYEPKHGTHIYADISQVYQCKLLLIITGVRFDFMHTELPDTSYHRQREAVQFCSRNLFNCSTATCYSATPHLPLYQS